MFFSETWLKPTINNSMVCLKGFSILRADRLRSQGDEVAVLYKDTLNVIRVVASFFNEWNYYTISRFADIQ